MVRAESIAVLAEGPASGAAAVQGRPEAAWITQLAAPLADAKAGPLAGLNFAAKDNIDVAGVPTTAACAEFAYTPTTHAVAVERLLQAGASLRGKTNLDQFACGLNGTRSPYGAVPNAFDPAYVSGGSSSGSAYVVATGQVDFALGTDTAGSGRVPAGLNNIVGLKPSKGLISARGVVPAAQSVDCVSIFAGTVSLAVRVLMELAAPDPLDPYSRALDLAREPLAPGFRFGVPLGIEFHGDAASEAAFELALSQLRAQGGVAVPVDYAPLAEAAALLYESALVAERYAAIRDFFDAHESAVMEPVRGIIAQGRGYSAADLCQAQTQLRALGQQAAAMWRGIDVLVVPTVPAYYTIAAMQAEPVERNRHLGAYTNFVNLLDYAALSVPSSLRPDGLPYGITLVGRCGSDLQLAELGQRLHHASGLALGATGRALPAIEPLPGLAPGRPGAPSGVPAVAAGPASTTAIPTAIPTVRVAVVGAHLSGMPLNGQLTERGGRLVHAGFTAPDYRLFALPNSTPPKPGLLHVAPGQGARIAIEVWELPMAAYGSFVALIPPPLGIGTLSLEDGGRVQGFLCEPIGLEGATDITHLGGWRAYIQSLKVSA
jgi:allophanate hydrolase